MKRFALTAAIAVVVIYLVWLTGAYAHDAKAMTDQKRDDWFTSLKTPDGGSCCNLTDCHETEARQMPDQSWEAVVGGHWRPIPPEKVLTNPKSIDGAAYLCSSNYFTEMVAPTIYCFIPPVPGY